MKIELEKDAPETVRLDTLVKGETFMDGPTFYMRVSQAVSVLPEYVHTINLQTGDHRATRGDVGVVPVVLSGTKATKLKIAPASFAGLEGGAS